MRLVIKSLLLVCVYIFSQLAMASPLIVHDAKQDLAHYIEYIEDQTQQLTIQEVLHQPKQWRMQKQDKPYFGYSKSAYWLKVDVQTTAYQQSIPRLLEVAYPLLDDIQIFLVQNQKVIQQWQLGDKWLFEQREIPHHLFIVPINLAAQQHYQLYFRIQSSSGLQVPISLWPERSFWQHDQTRQLLLGCFYGSLIIMIAYNFFIWLSVREKSYLFYVIFVISFGMLLASIDGLSYQYLWPNAVSWNGCAIVVLLNLSLAMSLVFSRHFLNTKKYNPRLHKIATVYMSIMFVMAALSFYVPYRIMIIITLCFSMGTAFLVMTIGINNWRAGNRAARFFVCSWVVLASMVVLYDLSQLGIIPKSTFTNLAVQIGEWCEVMLLSFALADRINISRLQEQEAQALLMEEERRANAERELHFQTKIRAQEEEMRAKQAIDQAQSESRAKSLFLATMSHEIRTPMNGVLGMTELLLATQLNNQQEQFVRVIENSGNALLNIINDILDYSKIEAGKMDIEYVDMDLDNLLLECASIFSLTAEQKRLEFLASIEPHTPVFIKSDPTRLKQILLNLLSNAFKFTHRGRISLRVDISSQAQQTYLHFKVTDTGIGMSEEQQNRLFQAFTQADASTTRQFGGTGLGLSISKRLIELMNGTMTVHSLLGEGTTFDVCLPYQQASTDYAHDHFVPLTALEGLKILFVDDSIDFGKIMVEQAQAWGMVAEIAANGVEGLKLLREAHVQQKPFDIVALDMRMPDMTGLEVALAMAEDPQLQSTKRVLLTAMRMPPSADELAQAGLSLVIQKPASANSLRDALLKLLGCQEQYKSSSERRQDLSIVKNILHNKHILIAEDNDVNQMVIVGMLKRLGMTADIAKNGEEALALYQQNYERYQLVLMDCEMPEMDGYEATQKIRQLEHTQNLRAITIIALTAHAMRDQQQRCLQAGMDDFLTKPLAFERLKQLLMQIFWQK